ncbi:MAG: hypothetical protein A07HB70_00056 [uncultured archaeon A07HB70]|nr:MAG: hypothetical protein A07HB70_00056 [uncultured archaeon A07HB70]
MFETDHRGLSPVVGVVALVVITLMMGVSVAWSAGTFETTLPEDRTDSVVDDGTTNQRVQPVEDEVIYALDDDAGETTTHVVVLEITGDNVGNSLNEIEISYAASGASGTGADKIRLAGFDTDDDGRIEVDWSDDVETNDVDATNGGLTLTVGVTGNYDLDSGKALVFAFRGVENPGTAGSHTVEIDVNDEQVYAGTLTVD